MTGILATIASQAITLVTISDQFVGAVDSVTVTSTYVVAANKTTTGNGLLLETWLVGGAASSFEVRATLQSGALTAGTTGAWLSCASDRSWSVTRSGFGTSTAVILVEIREASSGVVRDSATITIQAVHEFGGGGG